MLLFASTFRFSEIYKISSGGSTYLEQVGLSDSITYLFEADVGQSVQCLFTNTNHC